MQPKQGTWKINMHCLHPKGMAQQVIGNLNQTLSYLKNAAQTRYKEKKP